MAKARAPRNRTLSCTEDERFAFASKLLQLSGPIEPDQLNGSVINQDWFSAVTYLPRDFVDLLIVDPPYNLTKDFHGQVFRSQDADSYRSWFEAAIRSFLPLLTTNATVYICSDWKTSTLIFPILEKYFFVRNRITWEREKGRGSKTNWKNNTEDIWFCTLTDDYYFDVDAVKLKRKVIAPYTSANGKPKDWQREEAGNYRLTHPSNIWTDITVPFWSMSENTDHPTQKPEKLIAKLILASSSQNDFVFDPFAGSGTTLVAAKKLGRPYSGVEINTEYCIWTQKRLSNANHDASIQGYSEGVFWERNSLTEQRQTSSRSRRDGVQQEMFR